jgi:hypothetical protein
MSALFLIIGEAASSGSSEAASDGPLGTVVRGRWRAGVDWDVVAACVRAAALSFWWSIVVINDRRVVNTNTA